MSDAPEERARFSGADRFLLPAGAGLFLAASLVAGGPLLAPAAALVLSLLSFAPVPDRFAASLPSIASRIERRFGVLLALSVLAIAFFHAWLWGVHAYGFQPVVHDEFAYLFQTKTFLAGRLSYPPPPDRVAFDAFHILTDPVWAAKYPPGHALLLLPGAAIGFPWLAVLLAGAAALFLLGRLSRPVLGAPGALALVLFFGISPAGIQTATSYLSQTTYLVAALVFLFCLARWIGGNGFRAPALAGPFLGLAFLIRHWNAIVLGAFSIALVAAAGGGPGAVRRPRSLAAFLAPLLLALLAGAAYNRAITGSALQTPWERYAETSQPEDRFGFYRGELIERRDIGPGKEIYNERVLYPNRTIYTPAAALRSLFSVRIPMSAWESLPPIGFLLLAPLLLAFRGPRRAPALLALGFGAAMHAAYLLYWFPWGPYYYEITPLLIALPLLGAREAVARSAAAGRPGIALAALLLLLLVAWQAAARLPFQVDFRRQKASYHARFEQLIERRTPPGSILFLRYAKNHNPDLDLVNNDPDLAEAERIFAYDLGEERNRALGEKNFPAREPFHFDEARRTVVPGYSAP
ncbi:MAG: hypothetical protein EHM19_00975 [Candidatus Latescibacterota bacterium]|nr:MAG: hypothetical protein EHM19_00975 [Candidatus Latescibacterota bacterium]